MIYLTPKPSQSFYVYRIQSKEKLLLKNCFLRKRRSRDWKKNEKKVFFLTALVNAIKKDPTMSIRKHTNGLKVHEKTVWPVIKQDLSPDAIWGVLENKTNTTSHPNINSFKVLIHWRGME